MAKYSYNFNPSKGLYINNNSFLDIPEGVSEVCDNVWLNRSGIIQKRRGFTRLYNTEVNTITDIMNYTGNVFVIEGGALYKCVNGVPTTVFTGATFTERVRTAEGNNNLYLAEEGKQVWKTDGVNSERVIKAGLPKALDLSLSEVKATGAIHSPDSQVAYRVLFGYYDENNNKLISAPSSLVSITNGTTNASAAEGAGTVTVTSNSHGLTTGNLVKIVNAVDNTSVDVSNINGEYTVVVSDPNTFTFNLLATPVGTLAKLEWGVYKKPTVKASIPSGIPEGYFYQVYRSSQSIGENILPLEDLQLVDEVTIEAVDITNGYISYIDEIPDSFKGAYCYTNPSQDGILAANNPPPACKDITYFRNCMFYANIKELANKRVTLVSVSSMVNGDTLTITIGGDNYTYTAGAAESGTTFFLQNTSSVSINIDTTARSLASVINKDAICPVQAYYVSGVNDAAGQLFLEAIDYSVESFSITTNTALAGSNFSPVLPASGASYAGINEERTNRVFFSKILEPEAVPSVNYLDIGDKSTIIKRILPLKDSIIVLTNKAVYRIGGDAPSNFYYRVVDSSVEAIAPSAAVVLDDKAIFLALQGVCAASESSVAILSENINPHLLNAIESGFADNAVAIAYPTESMYILTVVKENPDDVNDLIVYNYNGRQGFWSTADNVFHEAVISGDLIHMLSQDKQSIYIERKDRASTDFADSDNYSCEVTEIINPFTVVVESSDIPLLKGYALYNAGEYQIIEEVEEVDAITFKLTFNTAVTSVVTDTYRIDTPILTTFRTSPITLDDVSLNKSFTECQLNFRNDRACSEVAVIFTNDVTTSPFPVVLTNMNRYLQQKEGWGSGAFGMFPWGDPATELRNYLTDSADCFRTYLPSELVRSKWLQVELRHDRIEPIDLQTITVVYTGSSGKKKER